MPGDTGGVCFPIHPVPAHFGEFGVSPLGEENLARYQWRLYKDKATSHPVSTLAR